MKKRLFSVVLVICMLLSACGTKENERAMENEVMSEESVAEQEKEIEEVMEKGEDEKEAVVAVRRAFEEYL